MIRGDTFRRGHGAHLWIVVNDPEKHPSEVITVNLTTQRGLPQEDRTCILSPGEHPFVRHATIVLFENAQIRTNSALENGLRTNQFQLQTPASDALLAKIIDGFRRSPRSPPDVKNALARQGLV